MKYLKKCIDLKKDYFEAHNEIAFIHYIIKEYEKSLEILDESEKITDSYRLWYLRGLIFFDLKNFDKSLECFYKA